MEVQEEPRGRVKVGVKIEAFEPCPIHAPEPCDCPKVKTGEVCQDDITCKGLAQLIQLNILATGETIKDTSNANNVMTANGASSAPLICAGTTGTAAAFTD